MEQAKTSDWGAKEEILSPYEKAESVWNDRLGHSIKQAHNWRLAAFSCIALAFLSVGGMIYLGQLPKRVVELVEVDKTGRSQHLGQAGQSFDEWRPTERQINFHLKRFIRLTRALSSDMIVVKDNWKEAYNYISDEAINQLNEENRKITPFARMKKERVTISIENTLRLSPDTWQINWKEQIWSTKGVKMDDQHWRGTFTIKLINEDDDNYTFNNPLGMYIAHYAWSKVLQ